MNHEVFMQRCINLALQGQGNTSPNPMVGSVVVYNNTIIGEGYHTQAGSPHAEVNAIQNVKNKDLLPLCTLYVTLEPCSHFGKTPPCSDLIIEHGIKHVVIGSRDPNPLVAGKGINKLLKSGVNVEEGILEQKCIQINSSFFKFHQKQLPYIMLKWAQTANGFIDEIRTAEQPPLKITNFEASSWVHFLRGISDGVLIGAGTLLLDNPKLNTRYIAMKSATPIVLGWPKNLKKIPALLSEHDKVFVLAENLPTIQNKKITFIQVNPDNLTEVLHILAQHNFQRILVEGGLKIHQSFINENLFDEIYVFKSEKVVKKGIPAPNVQLYQPEVFYFSGGNAVWIEKRNNYKSHECTNGV